MNQNKTAKSEYTGQIEGVVRQLDSMRSNVNNPVDVTFAEFINQKWGIGVDALYDDLGIEPHLDTIQAIETLPDTDVRWLVPEIIRDALRLGLRKAPIWSDLIAAEEPISQLQATVPHLNMSDAAPKEVGEAETIGLGALSYGQKEFKLKKYGRGLKMTDEVKNYVSLNVLSVWLQDFGVKLNHGIDTLALNTLINGEQTDGSESAPVIGSENGSSLAYKDLLRVWIRMARIGRNPQVMIGGETAAINTLEMDEFKNRYQGTPHKTLNVKTPLPQTVPYYIHSSIPATQSMIVDTSAALMKFNAQPLMVESERIVSNQTEASYASLTTGFAIVYRDARIIIDEDINFSGNGFPTWMDVDALEQVSMDR